MTTATLEIIDDATAIELALDQDHIPSRLSANQLDALIASLADARSKLSPVHPALPGTLFYTGDNLLWNVCPAADKPAIELGVQHPGLGWLVLQLAREQIEDLQTCIEFALNYIERPGDFTKRFHPTNG